jgi:hypothetical protein
MDHRKWIACVTGRRGAIPLGRRMGAEMDAWVYRLNDANDTRFYRTGPTRAPPEFIHLAGQILPGLPVLAL